MFAGHLGVALAAKSAEPEAPLGALVAASFGIDMIWPILLLAGVESVAIQPGATAFTPLDFQSYPWSHSLLLVGVWSLLAFGAARTLGATSRVAGLLGLVVLSHWVLDALTHRPDLPLWPDGPMVGFGLWNSVPGTFVVEGLLFLGAGWVYARRFPPRDAVGKTGLLAIAALVGVIWAAGPFSPPPPGPEAVAWVGLGLWILPFWAWRVERHRRFASGTN